ncbi:peptidyl-tRNA hydrolase [Cristinia sonorae]|uniref:peptidyl-tRNA hydrolase n=1 Tax=Cristinia sonorae TaxID=1940300 RepID=A0A8K0V1V4_9AGAR|nr:peptidyl-tRNA hydrolase [Cristinia sonorae]
MNLSGPPVAAQLRTAGIPSLSLVVIHDSLSHRPLVVSPKFGGSANGHNGVRSIIAALGNNPDFHRIRVGIGKNDGQDAADYVMAKLSEAERNFWSHGGKGVDHVWKHIETIAQSASR